MDGFSEESIYTPFGNLNLIIKLDVLNKKIPIVMILIGSVRLGILNFLL